jgi:putative aldouronate transport system substrate-binding protein
MVPALVFSGGQPARSAGSSAGPADISIFRVGPNYTAISYWDEALWVKELEKRCNVKLSWPGPSYNDNYDNAVNVTLASGDLPDLIYWNWHNNYPTGLEGAIKDGVVFDWTQNKEYLDMVPNWLRWTNNTEDARRGFTFDNGNLMPVFKNVEERVRTFQGLGIRQDWLDRLGLQVPRTIDEMHNILLAFKQKDANGNGDPNDEIPWSSDSANPRSFYFLISAWGLNTRGFYPDPQNQSRLIHWTQYQDGRAFTQCLTTLAQWWKEGLMDPDFFTQTNNQRVSKITGDRVGLSYADPNNTANWRDAIKQLRPDIANVVKIRGLESLSGPDGKPYTLNSNKATNNGLGSGYIITQQADRAGKTPAILKLLNYIYSEEGKELLGFGVEGVSFIKDARGNHSWTPAMSNDPQFPLNEKLMQYCIPYLGDFCNILPYEAWYISNTYDPDAKEANATYEKSFDYSIAMMVPILLNSRDQSEYNRIMTDINTAVNEFYQQVITGIRPVSEIPAFLARLKTMGIDRAREIHQAAYVKYLAK